MFTKRRGSTPCSGIEFSTKGGGVVTILAPGYSLVQSSDLCSGVQFSTER